MSGEPLIVIGALMLCLSPLVRAARRARGGEGRGAALGVLVLSAALFSLGVRWLAEARHPVRAPRIDPRIVQEEGYVGSNVCRSCHPYQHASWEASYHHTMTQLATPQSVLSPFDGSELTLEGVTWRLERRGEEIWISGRSAAQGGEAAGVPRMERRVVMTTGSHNYQLYWVEPEDPAGMQQFPLVYFIRERLWVPRKSRFLRPPLASTPAETGRWKAQCIKCHATRGRKEVEPGGETRAAELGIACEACHGPGGEHAAHNRFPWRRYRLYLGDDPDPTIVNPRRLSHVRSSQVCGQCHSVEIFLTPEKASDWFHHGTRYRPGANLPDYQTTVAGRYEDNPPEVRRYLDMNPIFHLRNCFWPDGMLRVAGREYHGLLESPCYQRGEMSCLSCHSMHRAKDDPRSFTAWADDQLAAGMDGDAACLQCHEKYAAAGARLGHTHHREDSSGSRCLNCHMPYTSWGLLKAIRSHTISSPSVGVSVKTGRPDACSQCHLDQTLLWSAEYLTKWYGIAPPALSEEEGTLAASVLWTLRGDAAQRALMAWTMGWAPARQISGTDWMVPYLGVLLIDPYDGVRFTAQRSLRLYPEYRDMVSAPLMVPSKEEQHDIMTRVMRHWYLTVPESAKTRGERFLLLPDGKLDGPRFFALAAQRDDQELVLFE
jgi:hypothetical protein